MTTLLDFLNKDPNNYWYFDSYGELHLKSIDDLIPEDPLRILARKKLKEMNK